MGDEDDLELYPEECGTNTGWFVDLQLDKTLFYGQDYAFAFGIVNPEKMPPTYLNEWRFETRVDGVILHLKRGIQSFTLEQLKLFKITPYDTTALRGLAKMMFTLRSDKAVPGGSKIVIQAPQGFVFQCGFFRTIGLSPTTTCSAKVTKITFTVDTQDFKVANSKMQIIAYAQNPQYTPQPNFWSVQIISPLGQAVDTLDDFPGYDITGGIVSRVLAQFPYKGQRNSITVEIFPTTIMNQADNGNEIVVTGPEGFVFTENCTEFALRFSNMEQIDDRYPNRDQYYFPPDGTTCQGNGLNELVVRLPNGAGLLTPYNYTIDVKTTNPKHDLNDTANVWKVVTRVNNPDYYRVIDANLSFEGFFLREPQKRQEDLSASWGLPLLFIALLS